MFLDFWGFPTIPIPTEVKIRSVTSRSDMLKNHERIQEVGHGRDGDHVTVREADHIPAHEVDHVREDVHEAHHVIVIAHVIGAGVRHVTGIVYVTVVEARHVTDKDVEVEAEVVLVSVIVIVTVTIVIVIVMTIIVTVKNRYVLKIQQRQQQN